MNLCKNWTEECAGKGLSFVVLRQSSSRHADIADMSSIVPSTCTMILLVSPLPGNQSVARALERARRSVTRFLCPTAGLTPASSPS